MRVCPGCGLQTEAEQCPNDGLITMDEALLTRVDPMLARVVAGKYRIESPMGSGGMGAVYKARHTATGGLVALKVMREAMTDSADAIKRFHLEAQNAAVLHSVHTVRVLDFGVDDGLLYLVMEYLEGEPLDETIKRCAPLPWRRAAGIARQVLESLWEAHSHKRRIVHRDIKPPNIFLVRKVDGSDFAKVIDFGIARALDATGANTQGAIGTPHAMAPEQWRGSGVDGRTDLYAVGCVLYEMLSGRPPFLGRADATPNERLMQLANQHMTQAPERIDVRVPGIPPALGDKVNIEYKASEEPGSRVVVTGIDDKDKAAQIEQVIENVAEAVAVAVEAWTGDDDKLKKTAAAVAMAGTASATAGPDVVYTARLSDHDHHNTHNKRLWAAHHIIAMDRANYHRYQRRDPEDMDDPRYHEKRARKVLRRLLRRAIDADTRERIGHGTPLVKVQVWGEQRATVQIVDD